MGQNNATIAIRMCCSTQGIFGRKKTRALKKQREYSASDVK